MVPTFRALLGRTQTKLSRAASAAFGLLARRALLNGTGGFWQIVSSQRVKQLHSCVQGRVFIPRPFFFSLVCFDRVWPTTANAVPY